MGALRISVREIGDEQRVAIGELQGYLLGVDLSKGPME